MKNPGGKNPGGINRAGNGRAAAVERAAVPEGRRELLSAAVELGVDREEITFESREERLLWEDLELEFQAFVAKIGPVWIAD